MTNSMTFARFARIFATFGLLSGALVVWNDAGAQQEPVATVAEGGEIRPTMPRLFYTNEQRRILEVVRQEFITAENLEFEEFSPLLIEQQEALDIEEEAGRGYDLRVDAYIHNRSSGESAVWLNAEVYELTPESGESFLGNERLRGVSLDSDGSVTGVDDANDSRFLLKVGQKLAGDGEVNETYPVIVVKRK